MKRLTQEQIISKLDSYKNHVNQRESGYNQAHIRTKSLLMNDIGVTEFNEIIDFVHSIDMMKIVRTRCGGISNTVKAKRVNCFAYDIRQSTSRVSLTILAYGYSWNFVVGKPKKQKTISSIQAWQKFIDICQKFNINFDSYSITPEEGNRMYNNKEIPSPMVYNKVTMTADEEGLTNVHHIDLHASYPSALTKMYPEFTPVIKYLYNKRKNTTDPDEKELIKTIMNTSISGCTMSPHYPWRRKWAHIAKFVREYNNKRIRQLTFSLEMSGRKVLGVNTDGIWYQGKIYHDNNEGPDICQWENDYTNCLFRAKSDGAYEFICNGKYYAKLRGLSKYDSIEPDRELWNWGDIYKDVCDVLQYHYDEEKEKILKDE